jgi:putative phosphoesterase
MTVRIGLISDPHATPGPVREALSIFRDEGVETVLCAGDIAGYGNDLESTVAILIENQCQVIMGNHDLWWLEAASDWWPNPVATYLRKLPMAVELVAERKKVYMVHGSPPQSLMHGIKLLNEQAVPIQSEKKFWSDTLDNSPFDVLVVGHTHQVFAEQLGQVLVINPGSTLFNHTCAILTLPELDVQLLPLSARTPVLSWNWGQIRDEERRARNMARHKLS